MSDDNYELREMLEFERMEFDRELERDYVSKANLRAWCEAEKRILKEGQMIDARWRILDEVIANFCGGY